MPKNPTDPASWQRSILSALLAAAKTHGGKHSVAADITRATLNYQQLLARSLILSGKLAAPLEGQNYVAILLPNVLAVMVSFVSLHMLGKTPCMLNFSSGEANILHACRIAGAKTIITSRTFIEKGKLEQLAAALEKDHKLIYLEDLRGQIGYADKVSGVVKSFFPHAALRHTLATVKPSDPAVILYTSGSEGRPKGVALSHANLLANIGQILARLDLNPSDTVFNALPTFHSFGLSIGLVMPMLCGIKSFFFPSPLQYREIPRAVRESGSTILLGTDTFLRGWAAYAKEGDFKTIRLAVAGAEKLKDTTRAQWQQQFSVDILQGYGVTEASPVISCNTPDKHKPGTVGTAFPHIECKLESVAGLSEGGRLLVKGPNIMLGYLDPESPGTIKPQGEWYDTGDIVTIGTDGFIAIQGRAKRFAKISGEMVSLLVIEEAVSAAKPDHLHAAVHIADERKGEQIILFTEDSALTRDDVLSAIRARKLPELYVPRQVIFMEAIPKLGSGKVDYPALTQRAATAA